MTNVINGDLNLGGGVASGNVVINGDFNLTPQIVPADSLVNIVPPVISGTRNVGDTLTCSEGTWTPDSGVTFAFQWKRNDDDIEGETEATHEIVVADVGAALTCVVTATADVLAESTAVTNAAYVPPVNTVAPLITGSTAAGSTLSCSTGTWTGTATITYAYQWFKDDGEGAVEIEGETASTYDTVIGDLGSDITCEVTADNDAPGTVTVPSSNAITVTEAPVYATWDTSRTYGGTHSYSGDDLVLTKTGDGLRVATSNFSRTTGKHCWQVTVTADAGQASIIGVVRSDFNFGIDSYPGQADTNGAGYYQATLFKGVDGSSGSQGHTLAPGDVVTVVMDLDNGTIQFWVGSTALAAGQIALPGWSAGQAYLPASGNAGAAYVHTANFGPTLDANGISIANAQSATHGFTQ